MKLINLIRNKNQHPQDTMCGHFQAKQTTLTFLAQIYLKIDLGLEILKTHVGKRITILEISYVPIFRQNGQVSLFQPKFAKNEFWGWNFKIISADSRSAPPRDHVCLL